MKRIKIFRLIDKLNRLFRGYFDLRSMNYLFRNKGTVISLNVDQMVKKIEVKIYGNEKDIDSIINKLKESFPDYRILIKE